MKKFLSIILAVCVISTLLVMPVSAAITWDVSEYLNLSAENIKSFTVSASSDSYLVSGTESQVTEYPVSNLLDGDTTTTAVLNYVGKATRYSGKSATDSILTDDQKVFLASNLVIDLGAEYIINGIEFSYPTTTQVDTIKSEYSNCVNMSSTVQGQVMFYKEDPATSTETPFTCIKTNQINQGQTYDSENAYRYIRIKGTWCNMGPLFLNELKVKIIKDSVDSNGYRYAFLPNNGTDVRGTNYEIENLFDGDPNTSALIGSKNGTSGGYAVRIIDLGESKNLTKISVSVPSNYSAILDELGITTKNGNYATISVSNTLPDTVTNYSTATSWISELGTVCGGNMNTASNRTATLDGSPVRYIIIRQSGGATYPAILSEIELEEYVEPTPDPEPIEATFESSVAFGDADGVETLRFYFTPSFTDEITDFGAYIVPFALFDEAETEAVTALGGKAIASGKTFSADLVGIPEAAYDSTIVAVPFVVSADDLYTYGAQVQTTVNALK